MKGLRVLVVNDEVMQVMVLQHMLTNSLNISASSIETAGDGEEAVNMSKKMMFDIILMDLNMPNMNGILASKLIKEHLGLTAPSIVALSSYVDKTIEQECKENGIDFC